jgi:two-component system response regulator MtrA
MADALSAIPSAPLRDGVPTSPSPAPRRVLVVDDDERLLRVVGTYLSIEGYEVVSATDAEAALAEVTRRKPDLIIMDVMMPGIDGLEACGRIRADPATASIPVLLFSALSSGHDAERARLAGANHLITKPFNLAGLAEIVASFCAVDGAVR